MIHKLGWSALLAWSMASVAAADVLVSDGFPIGTGAYAETQTQLKSQTITDETVVGWEWSAWNNGGGTGVIYSFGTDSGLEFPAVMTANGFTPTGGSIGIHSSSTGNPRVAERRFSLAGATGKLYLRLLLNADSTTIGAIDTPASASDRMSSKTSFVAGLSASWNTDAGTYEYLFSMARNLLFGVTKSTSGNAELDLCVIDSSGVRTICTLVSENDFVAGATYLCLAEIDIGAGDGGEEHVRAMAAKVDDYSPNLQWAALADDSDTLELEIWSDDAYPSYFGLGGRYQNNGGYFKVDEFVLASSLAEVVYAVSGYPEINETSIELTSAGVSVSAAAANASATLMVTADDGTGNPIVRTMAENSAVGTVQSITLEDLESNHSYIVSVTAVNDIGSTVQKLGTIYTGAPTVTKVADADEVGLVAGSFRVTRADSTGALAVNYVCSGTAVSGVNYEELSGTVTIPAGETSAEITVTPIMARPFDSATELTLTLAAGRYVLEETAGSATMTIANLSLPDNKNVWVAAAEGVASDAANWSMGRLPVETDDILLDGTYSNAAMTWDGATSGMPSSVASWTQSASYTAQVTMPTTRSGDFTAMTITGNAVLNGGEWWRAANAKNDGNTAKVWLNVAIGGDLTVGEGFTFNGAAAGYPKQKGYSSGGEKGSTGGAHGGLGGGGTYGYGTVYGDYKNPVTLGSGQYGSDNAGGGAVILNVTGDFTLDGTVTADAGNGGTGSGQSGGSVWIRAKSLSGAATGLISANGGSPSNKRAGGGAGRISIQLSDAKSTQASFKTAFLGKLRAIGGFYSKSGSYARLPGAAGTIYVETAGDNGKGMMQLANSSWSGQNAHVAVALIASDVTWDVSGLALTNNGRVGVAAGGTLSVPAFSTITGDGSTYCRFGFIGGSVISAVKHDTLVADGFGVTAYATTDFGAYRLVVPDTSSLTVAEGATFTVGSLKLNGVKLASGTYEAATLAETYSNVSGAGTIKVTGLADGLFIFVQ